MSNLCEYYPCHSGIFPGFMCEFCYCPEYVDVKCSGNPKWIRDVNGCKIKDCSECLVPHTAEYVKKHFKGGSENG